MKPWLYSTRGTAICLFLTCWIVFTVHFASNTVREIYLALAIGDHFSFRVDEYANMHPDLFEKEGYGWHIGNNPGVSMLAAIPYALSRPIIDPIVRKVNERRSRSGLAEPPSYDSPWSMAREFYQEAWKRGYDIKFGLASFVMQSMCMAPTSALAAVVMFYLMRRLFGSDRTALWLALLYAFGTPVLFRTGFLNHNLMLGHIAFMGFIALWNPGDTSRISKQMRFFLGGLAGGTAVLFDYSGIILITALFLYGVIREYNMSQSSKGIVTHGVYYILGTLGPVFLLWLYQWRSFGHPFYPGQHWMPPVEWIELGYQGYGWPQFELLKSLALDHRYGFFTSSPLLILAVLFPFMSKHAKSACPKYDLYFMLFIFAAFWIFFSGSNYTRLQFNTGVRYMSAMFPFMFVPCAVVLMRLPLRVVYFIAVLAVAQSWCLAMYRDVERGLGLLEPVLHVFVGGFKLPILTVLSRMGTQYGGYSAEGVSPLPIFVLVGSMLYGIWRYPLSLSAEGAERDIHEKRE